MSFASACALLAETAWGLILQPRKTFREILEHPEFDKQYFWGAVAIVFLSSLVDGMTSPLAASDLIGLSIFLSVIFAFARWFFLASLAALTVTLFGAHTSRAFACLITTGLAFVPWIFMAPVSCYRLLPGPLHFFMSIGVLLWVVALEWLAIQETYRLRSMEMYCLVFAVPSLYFFAQLLWIWPFMAEFLKAVS